MAVKFSPTVEFAQKSKLFDWLANRLRKGGKAVHLCIVEAHERIQILKKTENPNRKEPKKLNP
jgi:hypothetical protein